MEKFIESLVEMLDTEVEITMESYLAELEEWDSLSVVSFVAMVDINYGKKIAAADVRRAETVQELYDLIECE